MAKFEVGGVYGTNTRGVMPIKVLKRTQKYILVTNGNKFRMKIHTDKQGNEYALNPDVPREWRYYFVYLAERKEKSYAV